MKKRTEQIQIFIAIFLITFLIYYLTGPLQPTPYNHHVRLANSFLNGRLYLSPAPEWLERALWQGRGFVVHPPMPAILLLPLVAIFGSQFNQSLFSIFVGSFNVALFYLILGKILKNRKTQLWLTAFFAFGTNHWFLAQVGSSWYLSHIVAVFFLLIALYEVLTRKRTILTGYFLGAAYLSRLPTILSFPFFLVILSRRKNNLVRNGFFLLCGTVPFLLFSFLYNFARFGQIFEFGNSLIPGVTTELDYQYGIFNLRYIPKHLKIIFLKLPIFSKNQPYIKPSHQGMALWLNSPAFIFSLLAPLKEKLVWASWLAIFLVSIPSITHGTVGFSQFGYRFAMDFTPFLILLTAMGIGKKVQWYHKTLIIISILVNLWGVLWINKFGWVGW